MQRRNEFVYVKRNYFLPFKPLLDYEYKKFGYKKCAVGKGKSSFFNTAYYVKHQERPKGLCDTLYMLNLPFSFYRTTLLPILLAIFLVSLLVEGILNVDMNLEMQFLLIVLVLPMMLISVFLSNMGYNAYKKNDTDGKIDRALKSHGWTPWTSYKDNDPRFAPPIQEKSQNSNTRASSSSNKSQPSGSKNSTNASKELLDDQVVVLKAENGMETSFNLIAVIANRGKFYALLAPVEPIEGVDEDECFVFEYSQNERGEDSYVLETDDLIVGEVMASYEKLLEENK